MSVTIRYCLKGDEDDVRTCESSWNPEAGVSELEWAAAEAAKDWHEAGDSDANHGWPRTFLLLRGDGSEIGRVRVDIDWSPEFYGIECGPAHAGGTDEH